MWIKHSIKSAKSGHSVLFSLVISFLAHNYYYGLVYYSWKLIIFILSLWEQDKMWHWVTPIITQCLENLTESGELSVSMLGSLCSPCNMQDKCHHVSCFMFIQYHRLRYFKGQLRTRFLDDWRWLKQYPNTIFSLPYMTKSTKLKLIEKSCVCQEWCHEQFF